MLKSKFFLFINKLFRLLVPLALLIIILFLSGCEENKATGKYNDPYTKDEITRMMAYHGALAARFDGQQWWCLIGRRWVRIENGGAGRMVVMSRATRTQTNLP